MYKFHEDLLFFPERLKRLEKLAVNLHDKKGYVIHIRNLKPALNHELAFRKVHRVIKFNQKACLNIKFNQKAWLKPQTVMTIELRKKAKNISKKIF